MITPDPRQSGGAAGRYCVFGVPVGGGGEEQLVKTFERAFEAAAFAKLLGAGGRYLRVRVEAPA
jgi:hypothetical protein